MSFVGKNQRWGRDAGVNHHELPCKPDDWITVNRLCLVGTQIDEPLRRESTHTGQRNNTEAERKGNGAQIFEWSHGQLSSTAQSIIQRHYATHYPIAPS